MNFGFKLGCSIVLGNTKLVLGPENERSSSSMDLKALQCTKDRDHMHYYQNIVVIRVERTDRALVAYTSLISKTSRARTN